MSNNYTGLCLLLSVILNTLIECQECDILISGGTLAALGAAITAPNDIHVCLIEPTARIGGQLGDEGVWHFDFNWLFQKDYPDKTIAYNPKNLHPFIVDIMENCNTGNCWVSRNCFLYSCIQPIIKKHLQTKTNLTIYYNTTVKSLMKVQDRITAVQIISRLPLDLDLYKEDCRSIDQIIDDWYTRESSQYYNKSVKTLDINLFVIQASQYGDTLVLSNASYMQGTKESKYCGQSIVFGIHQIYPNNNIKANSDLTEANLNEQKDNDDFSLDSYTAEQVWRYRRLLGSGLMIKRGEVSLQNWNGPGNDYRKGYLFGETEAQSHNWKGGLNFTTLKQAEALSLRYHQWFKNVSKKPLELYKSELKTCKGTTRIPYVREGRRSIGYKDFIMRDEDITGQYVKGGNLTAIVFEDRMSIGMYNMDLHSIDNCTYEPFAQNKPLPFFIPLRAFSNRDISNLIVTGRAISQQFFVSSATRTHASELAMGVSSMSISNFMIKNQIFKMWYLIDCKPCIKSLQQEIRKLMPLEWTINGTSYPPLSENQSSYEML